LSDAKILAPRLKELNWHLQFFINIEKNSSIVDDLINLPVKVVIDHYGCVNASKGQNTEGYKALMRLFSFLKMCGQNYRLIISSQDFPLHRDVASVAKQMMNIMPDRLVRGTEFGRTFQR
jgi:predicted TIM-barrel fold metal-dependent hydrolase